MKVSLAFIVCLMLCGSASAQNIQCPTRPPGDNTNACSSTAFVQQATGALNAISGLTGDVSATGPGNVAATIQPGVVTGAKIGSNTVTNANLVNMAAGTLKCRVVGNGTGAPQDCSYPIINVTDSPYSADPTGVADSTTAIQNAINALPLAGGDVLFPCGTYKVSTSLAVGNGTSSTASTRYGVVLKGFGNSRTSPIFAGFNSTPCVKLSWAGSGANAIVSINGPLQTWGLQNVTLDCNSVASSIGLQITSAQFGESRNLTANNCFRGILSTTVAPFGSFTNTDSFHNDFYGTVVNMPATASSIGIFLTGVAAGTSNTDYNTFTDSWITLTTTAATLAQGILLQSTDTDHFYNTHMAGGNASAQCVSMDYSLVSGFPSSNRFTGIDTNGACGGGAGFVLSGTPGVGAKPNIIFPDGANGTTCANANIVNNSCFSTTELYTNAGGNVLGNNVLGAWAAFTPSLTCGTATFTTNSARSKTIGKTSFVEVDGTITAIGTCTATLTFTLPNTANSAASLLGVELAVNNTMGFCTTASASATATCKVINGGAFVVNERWVYSGSYENQ